MIRVLVPLAFEDAQPGLIAEVHTVRGETMGTTWQVKWVHESRQPVDEAFIRRAIEAELCLVVDQMSTWKKDSVLSSFNEAAPSSLVSIPDALADVLEASFWLADVSGGAFNPAAGAVVNLWGFGPAPRYTDSGFYPPDVDEVQHAMQRTNWESLGFNRVGKQLFQPGGVWLDLSAIAKGYAVDRVAQKMIDMGFCHVMVEVGGEFRGHGMRPGGLPWWLELEVPPCVPGSTVALVNHLALHGVAVATSGDYRRVYVHDGLYCCHSVDPRTGQPITNGVASVSVVHKYCMWADGWATALMVLGVGQGIVLAERHGIAALFVERLPEGGLKETMTLAMRNMAQ